jgi:hypothetical protein
LSIVVLLIALMIVPAPEVAQTSAQPTSLVDLSGSWRDDRRGQTWTISQNGIEVAIINARGVSLHGRLDGHVVKYTDQTVD